MGVRGCTKGEGGDRGEKEGRREVAAITVIAEYAKFGRVRVKRKRMEGGRNTTQQQYDTTMTKQAQNTQTKS